MKFCFLFALSSFCMVESAQTTAPHLQLGTKSTFAPYGTQVTQTPVGSQCNPTSQPRSSHGSPSCFQGRQKPVSQNNPRPQSESSSQASPDSSGATHSDPRQSNPSAQTPNTQASPSSGRSWQVSSGAVPPQISPSSHHVGSSQIAPGPPTGRHVLPLQKRPAPQLDHSLHSHGGLGGSDAANSAASATVLQTPSPHTNPSKHESKSSQKSPAAPLG